MVDNEPKKAAEASDAAPSRRGRAVRRSVSFVVLLATIAMVLALFLLRPQGVELPDIARKQLEAAITEVLPNGSSVRLGAANLRLSRNTQPVVRLTDLVLTDANQNPVANLPVSTITLSRLDLVRARVVPTAIDVRRLLLLVDRDEFGAFQISFGDGGALPPITTLAELITLIDDLVTRPPLSDVKRITLSDLRLLINDARAGRSFDFSDGEIELTQSETQYTARLSVDLRDEYGLASSANAALRLTSEKGVPSATLHATLTEVPTSVIAAQSPRLGWLNALAAPVSGSMRGNTDSEGLLGDVAGTLELGNGQLNLPTTDIPFEGAKAYLTFDPEYQRIALRQLDLMSDTLALQASGHMDLIWPDIENRGAMESQVTLTDLKLDLPEVFIAPIEFERIEAAMQFVPAEGALSVGQLQASTGNMSISANGRVTADLEGRLSSQFDAYIAELDPSDALAFWPINFAQKAYGYLNKSLIDGVFTDMRAAVRLSPGVSPEVGLTSEFHSVTHKFLRDLPPVTDAAGVFSMVSNRLAISIERGAIFQNGRSVSVAGTHYVTPNTRQKPGRGEVDLRVNGPVPAMLELLSLPPVNLKLANLPLDGRLMAQADIRFPTGRPLQPGEAEWSASGTLFDLQGDGLMQGRSLRSERMTFAAAPETGLEVAGPILVDGAPADITLTTGLSANDAPGADVSGILQLSPDTISSLGLELGGVSVSGSTSASFDLEIRPERVPSLSLSSDLEGLAMSFPALNWSKPANRSGLLNMNATLGQVVGISRLAVSAPGLELEGQIDLNDEGSLNEANFTTLKVSDWLDSTVRLRGRGTGRAPAITVEGGRAGLRGLVALGAGNGTGSRGPITFNLDRFDLTDGLFAAPLRGEVSEGRAIVARFEAALNGSGPVEGTFTAPSGPSSSELVVRSRDAGRVLSSVGVLKNARGGRMLLNLKPRPGSAPSGQNWAWDGELRVNDIRVVNAPVLAELLSVLSIVGLLEQLGGGGIGFSDNIVDISLTPAGITLREGRSIGPSMGITYEGAISPRQGLIDLQGVISPIYIVNGIAGALTSRQGEGLFGFSYQLTGALAQPQVGVNPLSILAPGFLREVFRQRPSELD